ncbi:MAG: hypothetical protein HXY48_06295 [Ignavibacteriaceae bacterium]|nr:hypothetical protein [Ignavibacteriaceae bacterium]
MEIINGVFAIFGLIIGWLITYIKFKIERKDKFRMAAIEKRLEAHQKAYALCSKFWVVVDTNSRDEITAIIKESREFMSNYSLYLESGTRKKMIEVIGFFNAYCPREEFLSKFSPSKRAEALNTYIKEEKRLNELSRLIQEEVALEPILLNEKVKSAQEIE